MDIKEPTSFKEILELQRIHEIEVNKPRKDGFVARGKKYTDLRAATMDEFLEFRKELPYALNFKTWKNKLFSAEKQLAEFVDILFFVATEINLSILATDVVEEWNSCWEHYNTNSEINSSDLHFFMRSICEDDIVTLLKKYILMAKGLRYTEGEVAI